MSAVAFLTLVAADLLGMFTNPYAGLVIFIAVPALFVFGLLLIPLGIWLQRRALRRDPSAPVDWPVIDLRVSRVRAILIAVTALTVVNATLVLLAAQGSLHYMESPEFCGQTCHTPMHPQYTRGRTRPTPRSPACNVTSARARGRSCTTSWPASVSSCTSSTAISRGPFRRHRP